jgi:NAD-dependent dihydropyrimidine dehydrogenase PreA subunit
MDILLYAVISVLLLAVLVLAGLWVFGERGHLMLPSTRRAMPRRGVKRSYARPERHGSAPRKLRRQAIFDALHAYLYGRWTNQYIYALIHWVMPRLDARGREHWANAYHGKVLTPELAAELVMLDHDVDARDLEQIVPYPIARDVILKSPLPITLYECACRHARRDAGCKPRDVCMTIGSMNNDFLIEHNPHSTRHIDQKEALDILRAEHERGHLHSAWFKDVLGNRLFAICNCCRCCCGGIEAMTKYGLRTLVSSGFVATIDEANCTACGICIDQCPFNALALEGVLATVNRDKCMGCGVCQSQCSFEAIALLRDETKPAPLDVRVLA